MCCSRVRGTGVDGICIMGGEAGLVVVFEETVTGAEIIVGRALAIGTGCFC